MAELQDAGHACAGSASRTSIEALIERCEAIRHVDSLQPEFSMLNLETTAT